MTNKPKQQHLNRAKQVINDEYYTQLSDIETEFKNYDFSGKSVYSPCDDQNSNFVKYFLDNFEKLQLKEFAYSCYESHFIKVFDGTNTKLIPLDVSGDILEPSNLKNYDKFDIIVTNPPFSLINKWVPYLIENTRVDLLILTPLTFYKNKNIIGFFVNDTLNYGYNYVSHFTNTDKTVSCYWITTLPINWSKKKKHIFDKAQELDNCPNVFNVDSYKDIREDDYRMLAVPISYLPDIFNKEDYNLLGTTNSIYGVDPILNGKRLFARIVIQKRRKNENQ